MLRLIGRRLLLMVPTLILASILIFALAEVLPGDVGRSILGPYATQEQVEILNEQLGADKPLYERYLSWAGNFVTGDWGESLLLKVPVLPDGHEGARQLAPARRLRAGHHRAHVHRAGRLRGPAHETASSTAASRSPRCR